jgi:translation initiation factor 2A
VDSTGKSYYGESKLYLMHSNGSLDINVPLDKAGTLHDVAWSPSAFEFVAIYGTSPPKITLFDMKGKQLFEFGSAMRNSIRWSPHGKFLCLGGFGNLQGEMDFWEVKGNTRKLLGSAHHACTVSFDWSPDSRYLYTAVTNPRRQIDNEFSIWKHNGERVFEQSYQELYQVLWRPSRYGVYPNRPASPRKEPIVAAAKSEQPATKLAPYRPPHFSGHNPLANPIK